MRRDLGKKKYFHSVVFNKHEQHEIFLSAIYAGNLTLLEDLLLKHPELVNYQYNVVCQYQYAIYDVSGYDGFHSLPPLVHVVRAAKRHADRNSLDLTYTSIIKLFLSYGADPDLIGIDFENTAFKDFPSKAFSAAMEASQKLLSILPLFDRARSVLIKKKLLVADERFEREAIEAQVMAEDQVIGEQCIAHHISYHVCQSAFFNARTEGGEIMNLEEEVLKQT